MKITSESTYKRQIGTITGPNIEGSKRWFVAIDGDPGFDEVSFHEAEMIVISENAGAVATGPQ